MSEGQIDKKYHIDEKYFEFEDDISWVKWRDSQATSLLGHKKAKLVETCIKHCWHCEKTLAISTNHMGLLQIFPANFYLFQTWTKGTSVKSLVEWPTDYPNN